MENIKFISKFTSYIKKDQVAIGNCIYFNLDNGNKVKTWCEEHAVIAEVIHKTSGKVDRVELWFCDYFKPVQCSPNAPLWTQRIDHGKWKYTDHEPHLAPKTKDYKAIATPLETYIDMYA